MKEPIILREPLYFRSEEANLFGWVHHISEAYFDTAAVICSPIGKESNHAHRTTRHTADSLAASGVPALRFDYYSSGDSDGSQFDQDVVEHWLEDIKSAIEILKSQTGCQKIILIGIRMGALLAAMISKEIKIELLILWYPIYRGQTFLRELEVAAQTSASGLDKSLPYFESAGFLLTHESKDKIKELYILNTVSKLPKKILILDHFENNDSSKYREELSLEGIAFDHFCIAGKEDMLALPHLNVIPVKIIEKIQNWVISNLKKLNFSKNLQVKLELNSEKKISLNGQDDFFEKAVIFNKEKKLFGVFTKSLSRNLKPVVLFLNTGGDHHVGSNDLTVFLSRELGKNGFDNFRIDFSGLGDSCTDDPDMENILFNDSTNDDIDCAIKFIQDNFENRQVILFGICAGGQAIYRYGIDRPNLAVIDSIIINTILYRWRDSSFKFFLSLNEGEKYVKNSMKSISNWKRLLKGEVKLTSIFNIGKIFLKKIKNKVFIHPIFPGMKTDLNLYFNKKIPLTLIFSDNEYGYNILLNEGKSVYKKFGKQKNFNLYLIPKSDHVFSKYSSRVQLAQIITRHLKEKFEKPTVK